MIYEVNDLDHHIFGTSGVSDDVARCRKFTLPVLAGGRVNKCLGGGYGVDSSLGVLLNVKLNEVIIPTVFFLFDVHDNGLIVVLRGGRVDDFLGATVNDELGRLVGE